MKLHAVAFHVMLQNKTLHEFFYLCLPSLMFETSQTFSCTSMQWQEDNVNREDCRQLQKWLCCWVAWYRVLGRACCADTWRQVTTRQYWNGDWKRKPGALGGCLAAVPQSPSPAWDWRREWAIRIPAINQLSCGRKSRDFCSLSFTIRTSSTCVFVSKCFQVRGAE